MLKSSRVYQVATLVAVPVLAVSACSTGSTQPVETVTATVTENEADTTGNLNPANGNSASTIDDGIYTVGLDIKPGTYRVTEKLDSGNSDCYWAITKSGSNGEDIIKNDIPQGGFPTVTLKKGQDFSVRDCGTWVLR